MATSIATGALPPRVGVAVSGVFNLVGAFLSVTVAKTISGGLVDEAQITPTVIFAGLVGAVLWNLVTWLLGLPSSSSHALFGGLIGATWAAAGVHAVHFGTVLSKVLIPAILSPFVAGLVAFTGTYLAYRLTSRGDQPIVSRGYKAGQVVSASMVSLAHGTNDAQKTMGVVTLTLITVGLLPPNSGPPVWVILMAGLAIAVGTYVGGWRIIRTLGRRITRIETTQGFAAETSSTVVILVSTHFGYPLSTTQVVSGAVFGVGSARRLAAVRWSLAGQMVLAWAFTLPAAAIVGSIAGRVAAAGAVGIVIVAVVAVAVALTTYVLARRQPVTAANVNNVPTPQIPTTGGRAEERAC
ncbi:inorganic phosphate transporter [Pseudonocardia sp. K10HN5]|uniref:Inorganic phosphate transporter n=2 Tax=Pseudonocardia acidicola TaxID=2724939 RepID=A0ABX1SK01_9PSEU|nr:inorganic phosphate transporter [Pseudonocardia acidicola]